MAIGPENALIVQSDCSVLLDVHAPRAAEARAAPARRLPPFFRRQHRNSASLQDGRDLRTQFHEALVCLGVVSCAEALFRIDPLAVLRLAEALDFSVGCAAVVIGYYIAELDDRQRRE